MGKGSSRFEQGMETRRAVLGDSHVDRAVEGTFLVGLTDGYGGSPFQHPEACVRDAPGDEDLGHG